MEQQFDPRQPFPFGVGTNAGKKIQRRGSDRTNGSSPNRNQVTRPSGVFAVAAGVERIFASGCPKVSTGP